RRSITTGSPAVQHRFDALIRERDGERLRLVVHDHPPGRGRLLVLSVETLGTHALSQLGHTLTRREVEVLLQVEQGKSNGEAAAALGISPLTVRCHLEHIFDKLNVVSRTGAVTRFRQLAATVLNDP
ncbi:MAG TPA: helix-turn-helix transcriptional regulator, partial [Verrucomicrobiota bacterium]|nr:helix-turn-helix transcriptional regulator [Verrucomicrobiota bacterium]